MSKKKDDIIFWGVDCGSSEIKVVALDQAGNILLKRKQKTLFPLQDHVRHALSGDGDDLSPFITPESTEIKQGHKIIATGYGRKYINFATENLTEIKAHFMGVEKQLDLGDRYSIIDIGGQDSKIIAVDHNKVDQFIINRKCAAGTGAYIEELGHRLEVPLSDMTALAQNNDKELSLNSFCTVFSGQEVIKVLMNGERVENIIYALYSSVVKRVMEMTAITTDIVAFSGGVLEFHPKLVQMFTEKLREANPNIKTMLAPNAQYCGAIGAALFGMTAT
ncbi:MAG: acyl-CoA dehydratase activase [Emcibacter sp.]|nr:acyl-CoA dehydratase activase [Emcibacter sp.]